MVGGAVGGLQGKWGLARPPPHQRRPFPLPHMIGQPRFSPVPAASSAPAQLQGSQAGHTGASGQAISEPGLGGRTTSGAAGTASSCWEAREPSAHYEPGSKGETSLLCLSFPSVALGCPQVDGRTSQQRLPGSSEPRLGNRGSRGESPSL